MTHGPSSALLFLGKWLNGVFFRSNLGRDNEQVRID